MSVMDYQPVLSVLLFSTLVQCLAIMKKNSDIHTTITCVW